MSRPGVVAQVVSGDIVATVEIAACLERVFTALTTAEIVNSWVNPGVFDTREWSGDLRVGGRWRAAGLARGAPYVLEGEYLAIDPPRKLVHTWHLVGTPGPFSTVTFQLEPVPTGTRLTVRHTGIHAPEAHKSTITGWETSLSKLLETIGAEEGPRANPSEAARGGAGASIARPR